MNKDELRKAIRAGVREGLDPLESLVAPTPEPPERPRRPQRIAGVTMWVAVRSWPPHRVVGPFPSKEAAERWAGVGWTAEILEDPEETG